MRLVLAFQCFLCIATDLSYLLTNAAAQDAAILVNDGSLLRHSTGYSPNYQISNSKRHQDSLNDNVVAAQQNPQIGGYSYSMPLPQHPSVYTYTSAPIHQQQYSTRTAPLPLNLQTDDSKKYFSNPETYFIVKSQSDQKSKPAVNLSEYYLPRQLNNNIASRPLAANKLNDTFNDSRETKPSPIKSSGIRQSVSNQFTSFNSPKEIPITQLDVSALKSAGLKAERFNQRFPIMPMQTIQLANFNEFRPFTGDRTAPHLPSAEQQVAMKQPLKDTEQNYLLNNYYNELLLRLNQHNAGRGSRANMNGFQKQQQLQTLQLRTPPELQTPQQLQTPQPLYTPQQLHAPKQLHTSQQLEAPQQVHTPQQQLQAQQQLHQQQPEVNQKTPLGVYSSDPSLNFDYDASKHFNDSEENPSNDNYNSFIADTLTSNNPQIPARHSSVPPATQQQNVFPLNNDQLVFATAHCDLAKATSRLARIFESLKFNTAMSKREEPQYAQHYKGLGHYNYVINHPKALEEPSLAARPTFAESKAPSANLNHQQTEFELLQRPSGSFDLPTLISKNLGHFDYQQKNENSRGNQQYFLPNQESTDVQHVENHNRSFPSDGFQPIISKNLFQHHATPSVNVNAELVGESGAARQPHPIYGGSYFDIAKQKRETKVSTQSR